MNRRGGSELWDGLKRMADTSAAHVKKERGRLALLWRAGYLAKIGVDPSARILSPPVVL